MNFKRIHITSLLLWIADTVRFEGGDGDAILISNVMTLEQFLELVIELNKERWDNYWEITNTKTEVIASNGQESFIITTNKDYKIPWSVCTIRY